MAGIRGNNLDLKPPDFCHFTEVKALIEEEEKPRAEQLNKSGQWVDEGKVSNTLGMRLTPPTAHEAIKSEDGAVRLLKAPVVWSAQTVKLAVSRISGVQTQPDNATVISPDDIKKEEDAATLPCSPVAWSPLTVKAAVSRLSGVQSPQVPQPSPSALVKCEEEDKAVMSTTPHTQCKMKKRRRRSEGIKVIGHKRTKVLQGPWRRVGENLLRARYSRLSKSMMSVPGFKDIIVSEVLRQLDKECDTLASVAFNSVLRESDPQALKDFSWNKVLAEWKTTAPVFLRFLRQAGRVFKDSTARDTPAPKDKMLPMVMSGALLLKSRSPYMSAPMYINSLTMQQGGVSQRCMNKLNRYGLCMSNRRMMEKRIDMEKWNAGPTVEESREEKDVNYEEGDGPVPEITYIVS